MTKHSTATKPKPDDTTVLEAHREAADFIIRAAERWADPYTDNRDTFRKLVRMETRIETSMRAYFREAAERYLEYVDWGEYERRLRSKPAAATVFIEEPAAHVAAEYALLFEVIFDDIHRTVWVGIEAGGKLHKVDTGLNLYSKAVTDAAQKKTADLVTSVTNTSKDRIRSAIETSIANGEELRDATKRVYDVVNDAKRAEMIARTESVHSYTQGLLTYGRASGATSKEWELSFDPCDLCIAIADSAGGAVALDADFGPDGGDGPPGHPNCRCGIKLNYDRGKDDPAPSDEGDSEL